MTTISRQALVTHSAQQMYDLVNDVAAYPRFLPWCARTEVLSLSPEQMTATLCIQWAGFTKSFTTANQLTAPRHIEMQLVDGPFKQLHGTWTFDALGELGCKVTLAMQFEFSNKIISAAFGQVFEKIAGSLVDSFTQRAKIIYAKPIE